MPSTFHFDLSIAEAGDTSSPPVTASVTSTSEHEGGDGMHRDSVYYFEDIIFLVRHSNIMCAVHNLTLLLSR